MEQNKVIEFPPERTAPFRKSLEKDHRKWRGEKVQETLRECDWALDIIKEQVPEAVLTGDFSIIKQTMHSLQMDLGHLENLYEKKWKQLNDKPKNEEQKYQDELSIHRGY